MFTSGLYIFPLLQKAQGGPAQMQDHSQRKEKPNPTAHVPAWGWCRMGCRVTGDTGWE